MLGGIIFQTCGCYSMFKQTPEADHLTYIAVILIFALCCLEYTIRYCKRRPIRQPEYGSSTDTDRGEFTKDLKIMVSALVFITTILFIR